MCNLSSLLRDAIQRLFFENSIPLPPAAQIIRPGNDAAKPEAEQPVPPDDGVPEDRTVAKQIGDQDTDPKRARCDDHTVSGGKTDGSRHEEKSKAPGRTHGRESIFPRIISYNDRVNGTL